MNKATLRCWLPLLLGVSSFSQASILNADFSQGFDHWQAQVSQFDPLAADSTTQSGAIAPLFPESFSLSGNSLTLSTAYQQDLENWSLVLFQDLQFDALASGQSLWLSLSVAEQQDFIDELDSKIRLYETFHNDLANWVRFGDAEPGDALYRVPLSTLP
mgnify:CR=1 FL=1